MGLYQIGNLHPFIRYKTSRSGGSGGQNVNKVETKVELLFDLAAADIFTPAEKERLRRKLSARILAEGLVQVVAQESRSQLENKEIALRKLYELLVNALKVD